MKNDKIDNQLAEIGLMSSHHSELIRQRKFNIFSQIMMAITILSGMGLVIYALVKIQTPLIFAALSVCLLAAMLGSKYMSELDNLDREIKHLEDEIDEKIQTTMAEITKDIIETTDKFIEELKKNREKAEQDALKCSLKGKNTKNNTKKAENKTKTTKKGDK